MTYDDWKVTYDDWKAGVSQDWPSTADPTSDDRPHGYGCCSVCGADCDTEQDYDPQTQKSTHRECLDPDVFCLKHGKEKPVGQYAERYSGCDECEPQEPDGEAFRGGEASAYLRDQQHAAQRLK